MGISPNFTMLRFCKEFHENTFVELAVDCIGNVSEMLSADYVEVMQDCIEKPVKVLNNFELRNQLSSYVKTVLSDEVMRSCFLKLVTKNVELMSTHFAFFPSQIPVMRMHLFVSEDSFTNITNVVANTLERNFVGYIYDAIRGVHIANPISLYLRKNLHFAKLETKYRDKFELRSGYKSVLYEKIDSLFRVASIDNGSFVSLADKDEYSKYLDGIEAKLVDSVGKKEYKALLKELDSIYRLKPRAYRND